VKARLRSASRGKTMIDPRSIPVQISRLREIGKSPAHYLDAIQRPKASTQSTGLGRLVHALAFGDPRIVKYDGIRRGKAWQEFAAANEGFEIVSPRELEQAKPIVDALYGSMEASRLLAGAHEVVVNWQACGRTCLSHIDTLGDGWLSELKTCRSVREELFSRDCRVYGYHAQVAFYFDASVAVGQPVDHAYIVAVESARPYLVQVFEIGPKALEAGRACYRAWLERLLVCEATNDWPGYREGIVSLDDSLELEPELVFGEEDVTD